MPPEIVVTQEWLRWLIVLSAVVVGMSIGGPRAFVVAVAVLGSAVSLEEPVIAEKLEEVFTKAWGLVARAISRGGPVHPLPAHLSLTLYFVLVVASMLILTSALMPAVRPSRLSRLFGGAMGLLAGLVCALFLDETLLPALRDQVGETLVIKLQLGTRVVAQSSTDNRPDLALIGGAFAVLTAGAEVVRRVVRRKGISV